ncbi:MAG: N-acetylmuramoyl-L-alanine amidase [Gemella sp.]|nr:N-acetylmuramoyl-L-alanine amidase [Gemella sp.]
MFTATEVSIEKETEIRTGPGENYPVLKKISTGEILKQQNEESNWIEVLTQENVVGWIPLWDVVGSNIKSPEERMYEQLNNFVVLLNPIYTEGSGEYTLNLSKMIKTELEKRNIKVILSRENNEFISLAEVERISNENKVNVILNVGLFEDEKSPSGISLYYNDTENSQLISKYLEKNLKEKYIYKVNSPQRNDSLVQKIDQDRTQLTIMVGNNLDKPNKNILNDNIYIQQSVIGLKRGVEEYLYYLLKIEDSNNKRKNELLTAEKRGLDIPFYYTNEEQYKNIAYGNDGSKTISENGDAIISLAMLDKYFNKENSRSVQQISEWAGEKYYRKDQGTLSTIVTDFAKERGLKVDMYNSNQMYKVDEALRENTPVLVQFKSGKFGEKISYKVLRGMHNNRYYINDPLDDNEKLNTYTPFLREDIEKNMLRAWKISK